MSPLLWLLLGVLAGYAFAWVLHALKSQRLRRTLLEIEDEQINNGRG